MKGLICRVAALAAVVCVLLLGGSFLGASVAEACPPVAVQSFGVSAFSVVQPSFAVQSFAACPQVAVQSVVVPQAVQVQTFVQQAAHVQAVAFPLVQQQAVVVNSFGLGVRAFGTRTVTVQRTRTVGCGVLGLRCR